MPGTAGKTDQGRLSEAARNQAAPLPNLKKHALPRARHKQMAQLHWSRGTDNTQFSCLPRKKPNNHTLCPSALFALNTASCFSSRFVKERKQCFISSGLSTEQACMSGQRRWGHIAINPYVNHTNPCKKLFIHWMLCLEQVKQLYPKTNHLLHQQIPSNF